MGSAALHAWVGRGGAGPAGSREDDAESEKRMEGWIGRAYEPTVYQKKATAA